MSRRFHEIAEANQRLLNPFSERKLDRVAEWDRYAASQWLTVSDYLAAHPDDPEAAELRASGVYAGLLRVGGVRAAHALELDEAGGERGP
jgi:hypothetical protein